jgi:hypothetical protein
VRLCERCPLLDGTPNASRSQQLSFLYALLGAGNERAGPTFFYESLCERGITWPFYIRQNAAAEMPITVHGYGQRIGDARALLSPYLVRVWHSGGCFSSLSRPFFSGHKQAPLDREMHFACPACRLADAFWVFLLQLATRALGTAAEGSEFDI